MADAPKPRRHHYFPQFHLAYFADAATMVWAFDRRDRFNPNPKQIPVSGLALEANLYDDDAPEDGLEGVEEWLATTVDGPASSALRKVVAFSEITRAEREDFARYVMSRDLRTPATREFIMSRVQANLNVELPRRMADTSTIRKAIRENSGIDVSEDEIALLSSRYQPEVSTGFWLAFLKLHTIQATPRLLAKGWTIIHADTDCEFITSDVGIVKHRGGFGIPIASGPGWWSNADGWIMPLTPRIALAMAPGLLPTEKTAQRAFVDPFNQAIVRLARDLVISGNENELRRAVNAA